MIKTVLGEIADKDMGVTLSHEHICCYSDYAYNMAREEYLDKDALARHAAINLRYLKEKYSLNTFIDCTPLNIGRDVDLIRRVSEKSEMNIVFSTGLYFTEEPILYRTSADLMCKYLVSDIKRTGAALIKCAVEEAVISELHEKFLRSYARAHLETGLPIVLHTNAGRQNARAALEIFFEEGVAAKAITVGHLSDSEDMEYIKEIASHGCYIGLDRLYENTDEEYIEKKVQSIKTLSDAGYSGKILLSHDEQFFNGFEAEPRIKPHTRFSYCFDYILPRLHEDLAKKIISENPANMLNCR